MNSWLYHLLFHYSCDLRKFENTLYWHRKSQLLIDMGGNGSSFSPCERRTLQREFDVLLGTIAAGSLSFVNGNLFTYLDICGFKTELFRMLETAWSKKLLVSGKKSLVLIHRTLLRSVRVLDAHISLFPL